MESSTPVNPPEPSVEVPPEQPSARQQAWATPVSKLKVSTLLDGAINLNVDGRQITNPLQGFGQLWQKTYRIRLSSAETTPQQVIAEWRLHFAEFWPDGNRFYGPLTTIEPGEVAVLNLAGPGGIKGPGGAPLISTGVLVIYADDESFAFLTPQGHMFTGLITFSASDDDGVVVAQVQALVRASDPIYEMSFRLGFGHRAEDEFWRSTLHNLARRFGVNTEARQEVALLDPRIQWSQSKNVWHNAAIRTGLYYIAAPFRWVRQKLS